jgi:hypothetical protein
VLLSHEAQLHEAQLRARVHSATPGFGHAGVDIHRVRAAAQLAVRLRKHNYDLQMKAG